MLGDGSSPLPLAPGSSSVGSGAFGGLQQQDRMVGAVVGDLGSANTWLVLQAPQLDVPFVY